MTELSPIAIAQAAQARASDPGTSAFVSAHAGAGKTKLLIDRLLRLMLEGADPAKILCLTFTKAAAAEMAIRLQQRLGAFVGMAEPDLDRALEGLGFPPSVSRRAAARALFARVLDLPGGMRIDTIHAFCQSLLRRFPLEAQVSPHFVVQQEPDSAAGLRAAIEATLPTAGEATLAALAARVNDRQFSKVLAWLLKRRAALQDAAAALGDGLPAAVRRAAGCQFGSLDLAMAAAVAGADEPALRDALRRIAMDGTTTAQGRVAPLLDWLAVDAAARRRFWMDWARGFLTLEGKPRQASVFCDKTLRAQCPTILPVIEAEQARLLIVEAECAAQRTAEASLALLGVGLPMLARYEAEKAGAALDFDDLIERTTRLLRDPADAAWVLYKLDGGLDHLLLDEVQDTAPEQWRIAAALTGDFFAGAGAREAPRTIFAVGDRKQSIFGFQGAEPAQFDRWRERFGGQAAAAGAPWLAATLSVSFRSTAPVLALVDAVFGQPAAARGVTEPGALRHLARRHDQAGAVELWPLAPCPEAVAAEPWAPPRARPAERQSWQVLADRLAGWVKAEIETGWLPALDRRPRAGDFLVLVRRRHAFARRLVSQLKARGVPVAGLDRMALTDQPAVRDMLAVCRALLLPQDELSFAEYLTSPLGGLADDDLLALAAPRTGYLFEALRQQAAARPDWSAAWDRFARWLARVDYAGPHALLAEILGDGGRARLLGRFGFEAAEPLDALLAAALAYEAAHPASLQGFLHWLEGSGRDARREPESAGDAVRIMTVHGAKGLEAPVVVLPDTTFQPEPPDPLHWAPDPHTGHVLPLWCPDATHGGPAADAARAAAADADIDETNRLLYVALTRARDRLVVCGWATKQAMPATCWHALVAGGMAATGATEHADAHGWGALRRLHSAQTGPVEAAPTAEDASEAPLPAWLGRAPDWRRAPPPPEPKRPEPLAPSRPEGVENGPAPAFRSPLAARGDRFARGRAIHALLQHLPDLPAGERPAAARRFAPEHADAVLAVLADPALAPLFGPGSRAEQPIAGLVGDRVVLGQVDRLCVTHDAVLIADYKTGAHPPATAEAAPVAHLRQMAAYRAVLAALFPGRAVQGWLVYTEGPRVLELPDALLAAHAPEA